MALERFDIFSLKTVPRTTVVAVQKEHRACLYRLRLAENGRPLTNDLALKSRLYKGHRAAPTKVPILSRDDVIVCGVCYNVYHLLDKLDKVDITSNSSLDPDDKAQVKTAAVKVKSMIGPRAMPHNVRRKTCAKTSNRATFCAQPPRVGPLVRNQQSLKYHYSLPQTPLYQY